MLVNQKTVCRNIHNNQVIWLSSDISYIRKEKYLPATTPAAAAVSRSGYPPWILKRGGLESSGRIPSS